MSGWRVHWRINMLGPAWFRRMRKAWQWYWSGEPMVTMSDVKHLIGDTQEPPK